MLGFGRAGYFGAAIGRRMNPLLVVRSFRNGVVAPWLGPAALAIVFNPVGKSEPSFSHFEESQPMPRVAHFAADFYAELRPSPMR
jgi:hypothetical protein